MNDLVDYYKSVFSALFRGIINIPSFRVYTILLWPLSQEFDFLCFLWFALFFVVGLLDNYKWPVCLLLSLLAWFWPFRPGYGLSGLCLTFSDTLYNMTFCEKDVICVQSPNCQHGLQESLQKLSDSIVRGEVSCQIT